MNCVNHAKLPGYLYNVIHFSAVLVYVQLVNQWLFGLHWTYTEVNYHVTKIHCFRRRFETLKRAIAQHGSSVFSHILIVWNMASIQWVSVWSSKETFWCSVALWIYILLPAVMSKHWCSELHSFLMSSYACLNQETYRCVSSPVFSRKSCHTLHNGVILCIVCHCTCVSSAWEHAHTRTHAHTHSTNHIWRSRLKCHITQQRNGEASCTQGVRFHQCMGGVCVCVCVCFSVVYLFMIQDYLFSRKMFWTFTLCFTFCELGYTTQSSVKESGKR